MVKKGLLEHPSLTSAIRSLFRKRTGYNFTTRRPGINGWWGHHVLGFSGPGTNVISFKDVGWVDSQTKGCILPKGE